LIRDAWLLKQFPGKTLDELDAMDYGRLLRALEAGQIVSAEAQRKRWLADEVDDLPEAVWLQIERNDTCLER
jgi:hypothetical protein